MKAKVILLPSQPNRRTLSHAQKLRVLAELQRYLAQVHAELALAEKARETVH